MSMPIRQVSPDRDKNLREEIVYLRASLARTTALYVRDGKELSRGERIIEASDLSGIPRGVIEMEIKKL
ncbi:MAG: hypothetical protein ACP5QR_05050 [Rhizomicrobium sp.]